MSVGARDVREVTQAGWFPLNVYLRVQSVQQQNKYKSYMRKQEARIKLDFDIFLSLDTKYYIYNISHFNGHKHCYF